MAGLSIGGVGHNRENVRLNQVLGRNSAKGNQQPSGKLIRRGQGKKHIKVVAMMGQK